MSRRMKPPFKPPEKAVQVLNKKSEAYQKKKEKKEVKKTERWGCRSIRVLRAPATPRPRSLRLSPPETATASPPLSTASIPSCSFGILV
uniref:Uncharacterized protein n=1 Tax=Oryza rufipogon TaxID=4529 RepID=A0A0E0PUP9_ORYRU